MNFTKMKKTMTKIAISNNQPQSPPEVFSPHKTRDSHQILTEVAVGAGHHLPVREICSKKQSPYDFNVMKLGSLSSNGKMPICIR